MQSLSLMMTMGFSVSASHVRICLNVKKAACPVLNSILSMKLLLHLKKLIPASRL